MADVVQWTIDQFYNQLQALADQINQAAQALSDDQAQLSAAYDLARQNNDPTRDILLTPLIHRNSDLRVNYLGPVREKFNQAVSAASSFLSSAGYTVPTLNGLGDIVVAPTAAVVIVVAALSTVAVVWLLTQAQRNRTATTLAIFSDPNTTVQDKLALAASQDAEMKTEAATNPPPLGFDLGAVAGIVGLVALIVLGPRLLDMFGPRGTSRATA